MSAGHYRQSADWRQYEQCNEPRLLSLTGTSADSTLHSSINFKTVTKLELEPEHFKSKVGKMTSRHEGDEEDRKQL